MFFFRQLSTPGLTSLTNQSTASRLPVSRIRYLTTQCSRLAIPPHKAQQILYAKHQTQLLIFTLSFISDSHIFLYKLNNLDLSCENHQNSVLVFHEVHSYLVTENTLLFKGGYTVCS